ncbi:MAG: hypothetical protein ACMG6E_07720 [Candidatus Roizmanbacteria bacterium]
MSSLAFLAILCFVLLKAPLKQNRGAIDSDMNFENSTVSLPYNNENVGYSEVQPVLPFCQEVRGTLQLLVNPKMLLLLPQVFWTGISLAVFTGIMVPMITESLPEDSASM